MMVAACLTTKCAAGRRINVPRPMSWVGCGAHGNKQHLCHTGAFNWTVIADDLPGLQLATVLPSSHRPRLERRSETVLLGQFFIVLQLL